MELLLQTQFPPGINLVFLIVIIINITVDLQTPPPPF